MKYDEFQEKFHSLLLECRTKITNEENKLNQIVDQQRTELRQQVNHEYWEEIGSNFKKMTFDDKLEFLKNYVRRDLLEQFLESHELTAYRMIK